LSGQPHTHSMTVDFIFAFLMVINLTKGVYDIRVFKC
jgi:hypothetical protein